MLDPYVALFFFVVLTTTSLFVYILGCIKLYYSVLDSLLIVWLPSIAGSIEFNRFKFHGFFIMIFRPLFLPSFSGFHDFFLPMGVEFLDLMMLEFIELVSPLDA
ncbi:hypothetical protein S83_063713 [Arachis hypogaea]